MSGVLISQRPLANIIGRVGPLLSSAIRRLTAQRFSRGTQSILRETSPLFALVGVTLAAGNDGDEAAPGKSRIADIKKRGFVTREEELEAICSSIRVGSFLLLYINTLI